VSGDSEGGGASASICAAIPTYQVHRHPLDGGCSADATVSGYLADGGACSACVVSTCAQSLATEAGAGLASRGARLLQSAGARADDDVPDLDVAGVSTEVAGVDLKRNAGYRSISAGYRRDAADFRSSSGGNREVDAAVRSKCDGDVSVPGGEGDKSAGDVDNAGGFASVTVVKRSIAAVDRQKSAGNRPFAVDYTSITGGDLPVAGGGLSVDGGNRDVDAGEGRVPGGIPAKDAFERNVT
jgi:hypothetical protein